jgi:hypothetical protein
LSQIQAKLTIGEPGDKYEQEADREASKVVQQINAPASVQSSQGQSEAQTEAKEEEEKQAKPEKTAIQRMEAIAGGEASTALETTINGARGRGKQIEEGMQRAMGQAMGADFSEVKVHTDAQADKLNKSVQARAFTKGQDVFFRQGEYNPGSRGGQELLAHELTHVLQQKEGMKTVQRSIWKWSGTEWSMGSTSSSSTEKVTDKPVRQGWWKGEEVETDPEKGYEEEAQTTKKGKAESKEEKVEGVNEARDKIVEREVGLILGKLAPESEYARNEQDVLRSELCKATGVANKSHTQHGKNFDKKVKVVAVLKNFMESIKSNVALVALLREIFKANGYKDL